MERPSESLETIRERYNGQRPEQLMAMKALHLAQMGNHERHVHAINDVLGGTTSVEEPGEHLWLG